MNAADTLKKHILLELDRSYIDKSDEDVLEAYDEFSDDLQDYKYEIRSGDEDTGLECAYSHHYETKAVGAKMFDGTWVGWTYYYGGGKHSEPEAYDWINTSYFLDCQEEERTVIVKTFSIKE